MMNKCIIIGVAAILLTSKVNADVIVFCYPNDGQGVDKFAVQVDSSLLPFNHDFGLNISFIQAEQNAIIDTVSSTTNTLNGGGYFTPDNDITWGLKYLPPISTTTSLPQIKWAFSLDPRIPTRWSINLTDLTKNPNENKKVTGQVIYGFDFIDKVTSSLNHIDGSSDWHDLSAIPIDSLGKPYQSTVCSAVIGDANLDGIVDLGDLSIVLENFGNTDNTWTSGNFENTQTIDLTDLSDVLNNFGQFNPIYMPLPKSGNLNPEPSTLLMMIPVFLIRKRRINI